MITIRKYRNLLSLFTILICVFSFQKSVEAEEKIGFSVSPVFSENQIDPDLGYFYLKAEPSTVQEVKVKIKSLQENPTTVQIHVNNAITNDNVSVEYSNDAPKLDSSLKDPISEILKVEEDSKEVTISNFEEKTVTLLLKLPEAPFSGIKLGGIRFIEKSADSEGEAGVSNRYGYTLGVMVTQDGKTFNEGADLQFEDAGATLHHGMKVVYAHLQNPEPKLLGNLNFKASVYKDGESNPVLTAENKQLSVAPNSNFSYYIPWGIEDLTPGTYTIHLIGTSGEREWEWTESFAVGAQEAAKINKQALNRLTLSNFVKVAIILLTLITIFILVYKIIKLKKDG
ncbi:hypothetical protein D920_00078 [Enterococcus faecalis 13-SD-W-01]|nr:hypothetical protein D920_00078 [Enterococcus faecalis 13-SD-W-01]